MKSICIFCGSSDDVPVHYLDAARLMGAALARRGLNVIYGGGRTGLMGALANGVLKSGGSIVGVILESLNTQALAHPGLARLEVFPTVHQRKARMYELGDAFAALPGGYGTFDELFETLSSAQVGIHAKPVGLLNVQGYFDPLLAMLDRAEAEGFIFHEHRQALISSADPDELLRSVDAYKAPKRVVERWTRQE